jgi:glucoamylase
VSDAPTVSHAPGDTSSASGNAPGAPGIEPRWTSSAKSAIGTALRASSRVWFTLSHGIFNEVYYPRIDQACLRDLGLLVSDGHTFVSEEKRDTISRVEWIESGVPAFRITNDSRDGRYRIVKEIIADPHRDAVLQQTRFEGLAGSERHVYVLLAPHITNRGWGNTAWTGDYKGVPMLFAERNGTCLAVACTPDWKQGSAGFVGVSDGWQDVTAHKAMTWAYPRAENGNVALIGEVDLDAGDGTFLVALAFGSSAAEAGHRARASLLAGFPSAFADYVRDWQDWLARLDPVVAAEGTDGGYALRRSIAVLRCHEEKRLPGAMIASLSIPWGEHKGDEDLGGYHLVWPRDLVESASALVAVGAYDDARRVLDYLRVTQSANGSWPQNMWVSGESYWHGIQLDETAFPILLFDLLFRHGQLDPDACRGFWPMIRHAARFIASNGPSSEQDRWEENAGLSPFTMAAEIAALLAAADCADRHQEQETGRYLRETADAWNDTIDACLYVRGTALARQVGVDGYFVRVTPVDTADAASPAGGFVPIKNRPWPAADVPAEEIVSPDALALVRFGLRAADDPRILDTIRVVDALLKVELPQGPGWRRYNGDGYGEHADGRPFDGTGIGRAWPLLTGERAHYELAAGRPEEARRLLASLEACRSDGGLIPEQVWDAADLPEQGLFRGRPSGSAMPLVWAHAEHVKLARSLREGRVFDCPSHTHQRYVVERVRSAYAVWRPDRRLTSIAHGLMLRLDVDAPCQVHWSCDGWATAEDASSRDTGLGRHVTDLPTAMFASGTRVVFTLRWMDGDRWEGIDYSVTIESQSRDSRPRL